ncbi:TIGR03885 family FMN-dependent LLM class oxidoreductase [Cellulomonas fimi]|uniref:TIGR03885 family FMN-dependent LLM class oxidoreductase n=1 Tax=Cellulomonas fimi TaxID=1708 RepID=A0A7Y0LYM7_CELFI|nr:TIGR03885 family FMN-dependent LLM class oxidoreductase [Cellulomonas fimi]NMR20284.1 TIGR03885 family FMN-dependent LLM class oxidoreductase [Cellulomonas fimi]
MTQIGFHASHEQISPGELLRAVRRAADAGFDAGMCSDHLAPWSARQGHSGFAWSWLGAALASTDLSFGTVSAPGQRYHPAVIAQASATLAQMFPGRFWVALGSGENANERITGDRWPSKPERDARLRECVDIIRALHRGEEVSHRGHVTVDRARIWSLPDEPPLLIGPAVSIETARAHADWADGLVTTNQDLDTLRTMIATYRDAGGRGELSVQVHLSWAPTDDEAYAIAHDQWRSNVFSPPACWDLDSPAAFDVVSENVTEQQVRDTVMVSSDLGALTAYLADLADLGFDRMYLHHVGQQQDAFIDAFGEHVLPQLRSASATSPAWPAPASSGTAPTRSGGAR